jgi:hypothetical protein
MATTFLAYVNGVGQMIAPKASSSVHGGKPLTIAWARPPMTPTNSNTVIITAG